VAPTLVEASAGNDLHASNRAGRCASGRPQSSYTGLTACTNIQDVHGGEAGAYTALLPQALWACWQRCTCLEVCPPPPGPPGVSPEVVAAAYLLHVHQVIIYQALLGNSSSSSSSSSRGWW
jgi:heterodisulfide reductase subunit C